MKKAFKIITGIVFCAAAATVILNYLPINRFAGENVWKKQNNRVLVMAHGGAKQLNPENTMKAFKHAFDLNVDVLEMDVMLTKDNILVTHHGENTTGNIREMSNGDGLVHQLTYDELQQYNFGYNFKDLDGNYPYRDLSQDEAIALEINIPKLEDVFIEFGDKTLYNIEIKADLDAPRQPAIDELYRLIEKYNLQENVLVATFYDDISKAYTEKDATVAKATAKGETTDLVIKSLLKMSFLFSPQNAAAIEVPVKEKAPVLGELDLTSKGIIKQVHGRNMAVHYWTINDPETMRLLIKNGADGIITDRPDVLLEVLKEFE